MRPFRVSLNWPIYFLLMVKATLRRTMIAVAAAAVVLENPSNQGRRMSASGALVGALVRLVMWLPRPRKTREIRSLFPKPSLLLYGGTTAKG